MKKLTLRCAAAALLPLLAACHVNLVPPTDYTETRTFDLASPAPLADLPFAIKTDSFSNECSGRFKMIFREKDNEIEIDEYNRWSMSPGSMLTNYLAARFAMPPGDSTREAKPLFELDGSVLTCELNRQKKQVSLMVRYFITETGSETFRIAGAEEYSIPVTNDSPEAFAEGLNAASAKFADRIVDLLKQELKARSAGADAPAARK